MAKVTLAAGRVAAFRCPAERPQAFLWDVSAIGLSIRATPAGKPSYVFQSRYQDKTVRITIGGPEAWSIPAAREKARELQRLIDEGTDPRGLKRDALAAAENRQAAAVATATTTPWPRASSSCSSVNVSAVKSVPPVTTPGSTFLPTSRCSTTQPGATALLVTSRQ